MRHGVCLDVGNGGELSYLVVAQRFARYALSIRIEVGFADMTEPEAAIRADDARADEDRRDDGEAREYVPQREVRRVPVVERDDKRARAAPLDVLAERDDSIQPR